MTNFSDLASRFNVSPKLVKAVTSGGVATYLALASVVIGLGFINALNSIPLLSLVLEILGLLWIYQNRGQVFSSVTSLSKPYTSKVESFLKEEEAVESDK